MGIEGTKGGGNEPESLEERRERWEAAFLKVLDKFKESGSPLSEKFSDEELHRLNDTFFNRTGRHFLDLKYVESESDVESVESMLKEYLGLTDRSSYEPLVKDGEAMGKDNREVGDRMSEIEKEVGEILDRV